MESYDFESMIRGPTCHFHMTRGYKQHHFSEQAATGYSDGFRNKHHVNQEVNFCEQEESAHKNRYLMKFTMDHGYCTNRWSDITPSIQLVGAGVGRSFQSMHERMTHKTADMDMIPICYYCYKIASCNALLQCIDISNACVTWLQNIFVIQVCYYKEYE